MRYAKILENGSLEYAPRNIDGVSNWIEDVDAVLAAGYLPVSEEVIPQGYAVIGWEVKTGEIVPILEKIPEPTVEELQTKVRAVRNSYLEKYVDPKQLVLVWDSLSADDKKLYKDYRQYLLDYPQTEGWYEQNPLTFDEWKESVEESEEVIEDGLQR